MRKAESSNIYKGLKFPLPACAFSPRKDDPMAGHHHHRFYMAATKRFFEMARKKAQGIAESIFKPFDAAISKKRTSLSGCVLAAIRVVKALARRTQAMGGAPCLAELSRQNSNAAVQNL